MKYYLIFQLPIYFVDWFSKSFYDCEACIFTDDGTCKPNHRLPQSLGGRCDRFQMLPKKTPLKMEGAQK